MSLIITDGTGTGKVAKVDEQNRLFTKTVSKSAIEDATDEGRSYNLNTGIITLTSANESGVLYLKNTDPLNDIHISAIAVGVGPSTGGTATSINNITVVRNPTGGTIVDNATNVDINSNRNFSSSKALTSDAYKGAEGNTLTGGSDHLLLFQASGGRLFATIDEVLSNGASIGVNILPQTDNTSMNVYVALILHTEDL
jgi:hypothetical protein